MSAEVKLIGIAVVEHDDHFLIGTRGSNGPLAGYAEFPGGKCEPGEPVEVCAVRECLEETGLEVDVVRLLLRREFVYPHATVDLHFLMCRPSSTELVKEEHLGFRWVAREKLVGLDFPEANEPLIRMLTQVEK